MDKSDYLVYRYFILATSKQTSIYHFSGEKKEDIIHNAFKVIDKSNKVDFIYRGERFLIYPVKSYKDNLYFFKIAKEHIQKEYKEGENQILQEDVSRLEVVNLVCQVTNQLIMIQKDTTAFTDSRTPINALEKYLTSIVSKNDYIVSIDEKSSERKFWDYVDNAKGIYSLQLNLNALNINIGGEDIRDSLRKLNEDFNNDEIEIKLKNREGRLKVVKVILGKYIDYISTLGGKYRMVYLTKEGVKKAIDSFTNIIKLKFNKNIENEDEEVINQRLNQISDEKNVEE